MRADEFSGREGRPVLGAYFHPVFLGVAGVAECGDDFVVAIENDDLTPQIREHYFSVALVEMAGEFGCVEDEVDVFAVEDRNSVPPEVTAPMPEIDPVPPLNV